MKKEEIIRKYGEKAWEKHLEQTRAWCADNPEKAKAKNAAWRADNPEKAKAASAAWRADNPEKAKGYSAAWRVANPEKAKANNAETNRKGGKHYEKKLLNITTGIQGEKQTIRRKHGKIYYPIKRIIDPRGLSNIHHLWRANSSEYTAVGIVEAAGHRKGIINVFSTEDCKYEDVIQLLSGKIVLAKEKDIPKFEARIMNTTEKRIKMDAIVAEIVKQRLLSDTTLEEWQVRYEVREEVYKNNI